MISIKELFAQNWKTKFPNQPSPSIPCLESNDKLQLERYLQKCNETIANLNKQLKEQEFIASFVWDLIHNVNQMPLKKPSRVPTLKFKKSDGSQESLASLTSFSCTPDGSDDLDNAIPIQYPSPPASKLNEYAVMSFSEERRSLAKQNSTNSIIDIPINKSSDELKFFELSRKKSLPLLDDPTYIGEFNRGGVASSLKEKNDRSHIRSRPIPVPRTSIAKIEGSPSLLSNQNLSTNQSIPNLNKISIKPAGGSMDRQLKPIKNENSKKSNVLSGSAINEYVHNMTLTEDVEFSDTTPTPATPATVPIIPKKPPKKKIQEIMAGNLDDKGEEVDDNIIMTEAPTADGEDSSDDGTDFYQNILLMKNKALNRVQTYYSSQKPNLRAVKNKSKYGTIKEEGKAKLDESVLSSDSVRSFGSDTVFDERSPTNWSKRRNLLRVGVDSFDSQSDADDLDFGGTSLDSMDEEALKMRKWVVTSILESEKIYLGVLDILMQYMTTFKNLLNTPQMVIGTNDIDTIFSCIPQLHHAHKMFVHELTPKFENWTHQQQIAEPLKLLALVECRLAPEYLKNFSKAVSTIHRCWVESPQFEKLTKEIKVKNMTEKPSIEDLLHKPVLRFQRNTLVLHDLIKCTPTIHPDYDTLQKTLAIAHDFLETLDDSQTKTKESSQRYLAKQGIVVEKVGNIRKLRYLFLFNDMIVCSRQKINAKQKVHFDAKWYLPLVDLAIDDKSTVEEEKQLLDNQHEEVEGLQKKIAEQQAELKAEFKTIKNSNESQKNWSFHNRSKNLDKIKKKKVPTATLR